MKGGDRTSCRSRAACTPEYRTLEAASRRLPLGLAHGLVAYLEKYPHGCTEQLVARPCRPSCSRDRPEFGYAPRRSNGASPPHRAHPARRARTPRAPSACGRPTASSRDFRVYALHFLHRGRERGYAVPADLLARGARLRQDAGRGRGPARSAEARVQAYALYVLTRNGAVDQPRAVGASARRWRRHQGLALEEGPGGVYLAATYELLKQERRRRGSRRGDAPARRSWSTTAASTTGWSTTRSSSTRWRATSRRASRAAAGRAQGHRPADLRRLATTRSRRRSPSSRSTPTRAPPSPSAARSTRRSPRSWPTARPRPLALPEGLFPRVAFTNEAARLRVKSTGGAGRVYYAVDAGGLRLAAAAEGRGEAEARDPPRVPATPPASRSSEVKLGDELHVHLRVRGARPGRMANVARGGPAAGRVRAGARAAHAPGGRRGGGVRRGVLRRGRGRPGGGGDGEAAQAEEGEGEQAPEAGRAEARASDERVRTLRRCPSAWTSRPGSPTTPTCARTGWSLYGAVGPDLKEFVYRIKATNAGTFTVPPPLRRVACTTAPSRRAASPGR